MKLDYVERTHGGPSEAERVVDALEAEVRRLWGWRFYYSRNVRTLLRVGMDAEALIDARDRLSRELRTLLAIRRAGRPERRERRRRETESLRAHLRDDHRLGSEYTEGASRGLMEEAHRTLFPECRVEAV